LQPVDDLSHPKVVHTFMPRLALAFILLLASLTGAFAQNQTAELDRLRQLIAEGKYSDAEKLGRELTTKNAADSEAKFQLGRALFFQDKFQEAIGQFEGVAQALPKFAGAHKYIGDSHAGLRQWDKAATAYQRAVDLEPETADYRIDLALALARQSKTSESESEFRRAMALAPDSLPAIYGYATFLIEIGRYRDAEIQLDKALEIDDKSAYGWSVMGDALRLQKSYRKAEEAYNQSLDIDPKRIRALDGLSKLLMAQELWKDAENATRVLIDADPSNLAYYLRMANIIDEQERYAESEAIYLKLMRDHPKFAEPFFDYGVSLWRQDKNKEAEAQFKAGMDANPNNAWFHYTYGNFLRQAKRLKEARTAFETALKINPNYREARERLDMVNLELG
jgi:tetratricopeptide (TPR) repeat protein